MNIKILAIGGRGDVQPLVVLGEELSLRGYHVSVATHVEFEDVVRSGRLEYLNISTSIKELFLGRYGKGTYSTESNYFRSWFNFYKMFGEVLYQSASDSYDACKDGDLIIYSPPCLYFAPQLEEKLKIPSVPVFFQPFHPTGEFPHYISPLQVNFSSTLNLLIHYLADYMMWIPYLPVINRFRKERLGLPSISVFNRYIQNWRKDQKLFIYAFSEYVLKKPSDWPENAHVTGYFFRQRDESGLDDKELEEFINSGEKPVFVGFSSTVVHEAEKIANILKNAFSRLNSRVVLVTGWGGMQDIDFPENIFKIPYVPYDRLFPHMSLLIHHGGAGSTASALRSGVPSLVIPFAADQYFWAKRVERTGAGPAPLPARELTSDRLYRSVKEVLESEKYYSRAEEIARNIKRENGIGNAADLIEELISGYGLSDDK